MKDFILSEIKKSVCCSSCVPAWKEFEVSLPRLLDELQPEVSKDGVKISYKEKKGRYSLSIMRFLTRKLNLLDLFDENLVSDISDTVTQGYFSGDFKTRLDKGEKITENYSKGVGGRSCMSGKCSKYTKLYEMNPERFEQLVVTCKNNSARAIIVKLDNGKKFKCRTYGDGSACYAKLDAYAAEQGWLEVEKEDMIVSDLKWFEGGFPYQDNLFCYCIQRNGNLTIGTRAAFDKVGVDYQGDTDVQYGHLMEHPQSCCNCETALVEDIEGYTITAIVIRGDLYCEECVNEIFIACEGCYEFMFADNRTRIEGQNYCESCSQDVGSYCQHCEELVLKENINFVEDEKGDDIPVCNECYKNVSFTLIREKAM